MYCICITMEYMDLEKIATPDRSKISFSDLFDRYDTDRKAILEYVHTITYPEYLPWEKARFKEAPTSLNKEEAWYLGREIRTANSQKLPIKTPSGDFFTWTRLNYTDQFLNRFDLLMGGQFLTSKVRLSASEQQTFMTRGVIEEAIASSQLEGASVTRKDAKEMIAENRTPRNKSEWMAYNNYRMMTKTTELYKDIPLSVELLLEMHEILSANTMETDDIGRLRRDTDNIVVGSPTKITYYPPSEQFLDEQLRSLIAFANDDSPETFMHPILKAIVLHFWVGYLHPFTDGNGRIARALFYWFLLKKNYWLATYVPISTVIKRAPIQYSDAYVYTEQDNNDFTYFFDYHMKKIKIALDDFLEYAEKQQTENKEIDRTLNTRAILNERQKQLMHYLLSSQHHRTSITSHSSLHNISLNTARRDLSELQKAKLIFSLRTGKFVYYYAKPLA
jgi:Fic family protein